MKVENIISEIVRELKINPESESQSSFYRQGDIGRGAVVIVRVSNHRTHLNKWAENYPMSHKRPTRGEIMGHGGELPFKYKAKSMYSFVFESSETQNNLVVTKGQPYAVLEFVYNPNKITKKKLADIIVEIKSLLKTNKYNEEILGTPNKLYPIVKI